MKYDLGKLGKGQIGVIGDFCLDVYWHADMTKSELSRESSLFVMSACQYTSRQKSPITPIRPLPSFFKSYFIAFFFLGLAGARPSHQVCAQSPFQRLAMVALWSPTKCQPLPPQETGRLTMFLRGR